MHFLLIFLLTLLISCQDHTENDPYIIENTEIYIEPPEPYYYDEYPDEKK